MKTAAASESTPGGSYLSVPVLARGPFHNAPSTVATTLSIRAAESGPARKVTKLMGYKQGGFALLSPYHSARTGVLTKMLMDYQHGTAAIDTQETEIFSASDRVKLSYHVDGFVQFSGERVGRIVSGRDPVTREPKGLGIMTNPMSAPVMTGPAFGIVLWGLDDFDEQKGKPRGDALTFGPEDFVYDHCDESDWGSYCIEFFIFGIYFQPYVRQIGRAQFEMPMWHNQYHDQGREFIFKVIRLGRQPFFLGALCFRRPAVGFDAASGWSIGSPGALAKGPIKPMLHAFYPADGWPEPTATIDYGSWQRPNLGDAAEPQFARDYGAVIERAEAELATRAASDIPVVALLRDGAGLIAEILEGAPLTPASVQGPSGAKRIAAVVVAINGLRAARGCALLIITGYTREALATLERLKSAHRLALLLGSDTDGTLIERFTSGDDLREVDVEALEPDTEATTVMIGHFPELSYVQTQSGPRRGIGFVGRANKDDAQRLALTAACLLADIADFAGRTLRADSATESLLARHRAFRSAVQASVDAYAVSQANTDTDKTADRS